MKKTSEDVMSLNFCDDTLKKVLPWDSDQFVEVKRLSAKQRRQRNTIASRFKLNPADDDMEMSVPIDELKDFEYLNCIIDFSLKGRDPKTKEEATFTYGKRQDNAKVYEFFSGPLEDFIDDLIKEVNQEDSKREENEAVKEITGNSESSSQNP